MMRILQLEDTHSIVAFHTPVLPQKHGIYWTCLTVAYMKQKGVDLQ